MRALLIIAVLASSLILFSQGITVKCNVTDARTREAMIGLNVFIKGTVRGVVTDIDGNCSMTICPSDAVLVFSYVGYEPLEVPEEGRTTLSSTGALTAHTEVYRDSRT